MMMKLIVVPRRLIIFKYVFIQSNPFNNDNESINE